MKLLHITKGDTQGGARSSSEDRPLLGMVQAPTRQAGHRELPRSLVLLQHAGTALLGEGKPDSRETVIPTLAPSQQVNTEKAKAKPYLAFMRPPNASTRRYQQMERCEWGFPIPESEEALSLAPYSPTMRCSAYRVASNHGMHSRFPAHFQHMQ